jgi:predicted ester cyclase
MTGTHLGEFDGLLPTGRRFEVRGVTIFAFRDDRIRRCADYWNLGAVRDQLTAG